MGLETGEFLADLDQVNPVTATDPVTEGADHLRLLKKVLQQTFPNFSEAMTLSVAQLNDAALKSEAQTIDGAWDFTDHVLLANSIILRGRNLADNDNIDMIRVNASDQMVIGDAGFANVIDGSATTFRHAGTSVALLASRAGGSLTLSDAAGAFTEALRAGGGQTIAGVTKHGDDIILANNKRYRGTTLGASEEILLFLNNSDRVKFGGNNLDNDYRALTEHVFDVGGSDQAKFVPRDSGALTVRDMKNNFLKAGFRNPFFTSLPDDHTFIQADEGGVFVSDAGAMGDVFTIDTLEAGTSIRLFMRGDGDQVVQGTITTMRLFRGAGDENTTGVTFARNSVVDLYWATAGTVYIFGNGMISV